VGVSAANWELRQSLSDASVRFALDIPRRNLGQPFAQWLLATITSSASIPPVEFDVGAEVTPRRFSP
jgi:hypothetical protein